MRAGRARHACALVALIASSIASVLACGETRKGPGEECLRGDDCLSGFCTDRVCTSAPSLGTPATSNLTGDASNSSDAGNDAAITNDASSPDDATSG